MCSGRHAQRNDGVICQWSQIQGNVALSSGEGELHCAVKGFSEGVSVLNARRELWIGAQS